MDPAGSGLYPVDPGKAPDHDVTTHVTRISRLWQDSLPSVATVAEKRDCRFSDSVTIDSGKSDAASHPRL